MSVAAAHRRGVQGEDPVLLDGRARRACARAPLRSTGPGSTHPVRHHHQVRVRTRDPAVPLPLHLGDRDRPAHEPLAGQDPRGPLEPVHPVGRLVLHPMQRGHHRKPAGAGPAAAPATSAGGRWVCSSVACRSRRTRDSRGMARGSHGARPSSSTGTPSWRRALTCEVSDVTGQSDDDDVDADLRCGLREVDQADLRAVWDARSEPGGQSAQALRWRRGRSLSGDGRRPYRRTTTPRWRQGCEIRPLCVLMPPPGQVGGGADRERSRDRGVHRPSRV